MSQPKAFVSTYSKTMSHSNYNTYDRSVRFWLLLMVVLVSAMIVLGGATRLTNSGLSITEWAPILGALPPLGLEAWLSEFEKYKQIPEFLAEHPDMELAGFKSIYFWEWSHRQLGRLIGLVYALPFFYFFFRKKLPQGQTLKFFSIMCLIGLQGAIGWWMVASGLVNDRVDVSQYRLATHLGVAFIILGALLWLWRNQAEGWPEKSNKVLPRKRVALLTGLVFLQVIAGAFVAGLKAGRTYNTWPLMDGDFVPAGYASMNPFWRNIFENIAAVQFNHRILAYIILVATIWVFISSKPHKRLKAYMTTFIALVAWQVLLGIYVLLTGDALWLALLHQFSAVFVWMSVIAACRVAYKA